LLYIDHTNSLDVIIWIEKSTKAIAGKTHARHHYLVVMQRDFKVNYNDFQIQRIKI